MRAIKKGLFSRLVCQERRGGTACVQQVIEVGLVLAAAAAAAANAA